MTKKSDTIRLRHMLDACHKAMEFLKGKDRSSLDQGEKLALALVRLIEIIGEAAAKVSIEVQFTNAEIPWKDIVGTRNRLIHGYEDVDLDIVWQIVTEGSCPSCQAICELQLRGNQEQIRSHSGSSSWHEYAHKITHLAHQDTATWQVEGDLEENERAYSCRRCGIHSILTSTSRSKVVSLAQFLPPLLAKPATGVVVQACHERS